MQFVALFFNGQIKNFEHTLDKIKSIKTQYNCICFASLNIQTVDSDVHRFLDALDISEDRLYLELTEPPLSIQNSKKSTPDVKCNNVYSMFYHNMKCLELINKHQTKYNILFDCVIKYRSDIDNNDKLFIPTREYPSNQVFIPRGGDWCGGVNDQIAYGSYQAMLKYSELVKNIEAYINQGINVHPETLLKWHLLMENIHIIRFDLDYTLSRAP